MRTYNPKPGDVERTWYVIDATDVVLGRLATHVATLLRGKHKATFAPNIDNGDFVIVINAEKIRVTGNKAFTKNYYSHSGYPSGLKEVSFQKMLAKFPERIIEKAVKRTLLNKNRQSLFHFWKNNLFEGIIPHKALFPEVFVKYPQG